MNAVLRQEKKFPIGQTQFCRYSRDLQICMLENPHNRGEGYPIRPLYFFYTDRLEARRRLEPLYPGTSHQSQQVRDYVETDFNEIERLLYSADMAGGSGAWRGEIDMGPFVNYYIIEGFFAVSDTFSA